MLNQVDADIRENGLSDADFEVQNCIYMLSKQILLTSIASITALWVLFDIVFLLNNFELTTDIVVVFLFQIACIPVVWWSVKWLMRCLFSEFMIGRGPKLMAIFRQFSLYFSSCGTLFCIAIKVIHVLSIERAEVPFPAIAFVISAAWFFFTLYSWQPTGNQNAVI